MHVDQSGISATFVSPNTFQQVRTAQGFTRVSRQHVQQFKLRRRQLQIHTIFGGGMLSPIHYERAALQSFSQVALILACRRVYLGHAQPSPDSGHKLHHLERFGHIIIRPRFQAFHHIGGVGFGGKHDDRRIRVLPYALRHLDAIQTGEHHIKQHQIRLQCREHFHRTPPIQAGHGFKSFALQYDG